MRSLRITRNRMSKQHKTILRAYGIEMTLKRIVLSYDGSFYYQCEDSTDREYSWVLQEHEIEEWIK
jgi:hypothetical protein